MPFELFHQLASTLALEGFPEYADKVDALKMQLWREIQRTEAIQSKSCPSCQSSEIVRDGKPRGVQRYKCNSCRRRFTKRSPVTETSDASRANS